MLWDKKASRDRQGQQAQVLGRLSALTSGTTQAFIPQSHQLPWKSKSPKPPLSCHAYSECPHTQAQLPTLALCTATGPSLDPGGSWHPSPCILFSPFAYSPWVCPPRMHIPIQPSQVEAVFPQWPLTMERNEQGWARPCPWLLSFLSVSPPLPELTIIPLLFCDTFSHSPTVSLSLAPLSASSCLFEPFHLTLTWSCPEPCHWC